MIIAIVGVLLVPKVLQLTNRVIEEYMLPRKVLKSGTEVYPIELSMALTKDQMDQLNKSGATVLLKQGVVLRDLIEKANANKGAQPPMPTSG